MLKSPTHLGLLRVLGMLGMLSAAVGCQQPNDDASEPAASGEDDEADKVAPQRWVVQAETTSFVNRCATSAVETGYMGEGFVRCTPGGTVEWNNVSVPKAGRYALRFRYANGSTSTHEASVTVNEGAEQRARFAPTASWSTFRVRGVYGDVELKAGNNKVRLTLGAASAALHVDQLVLLAKDVAEGGGDGGDAAMPVFLLAGQSNMIGNVDAPLFDELFWQLTETSRTALYGRLVNRLNIWYLEEGDGDHKYGYSPRMVDFEASELLRLRAAGVIDAGLTRPSANVMCAFNDAPVAPLALNCGYPFGPELTLGRVLGADMKTSLIKVAEGGTTLYTDWRSPKSGEVGRLYAQLRARIRSLRAKPASVHPDCAKRECRWGGFIWFQGENDSFGAEQARSYAANLKSLIADVRQEVGDSNLPVVIVKIGAWAMDMDFGKVVAAAQESTVKADPRAVIVPTDDLSAFYHYDPAAQLIIGERVAVALKSLLQ